MGISNTAATIPGIVSPLLTGYIVQNKVIIDQLMVVNKLTSTNLRALWELERKERERELIFDARFTVFLPLWSDGRGMAHGVYNRFRDLFVRRNAIRFGCEWRFTILGFECSISPLCFLGPHWWLWMDVLPSRDGRGKLERTSSDWLSLISYFFLLLRRIPSGTLYFTLRPGFIWSGACFTDRPLPGTGRNGRNLLNLAKIGLAIRSRWNLWSLVIFLIMEPTLWISKNLNCENLFFLNIYYAFCWRTLVVSQLWFLIKVEVQF